MTTLDIELGLLKHFDFRKKLILPRISWGAGLHECDMIMLSNSGYATEIEIKITKQDLKNDALKKHTHNSDKIKYFYFAFPTKVFKEDFLQYIPEHAGILLLEHYMGRHCTYKNGKYIWTDKELTRVNEYRQPKGNKNARKWEDKEISNLMRLGCLKIYGLKENISKLKKNEKNSVRLPANSEQLNEGT